MISIPLSPFSYILFPFFVPVSHLNRHRSSHVLFMISSGAYECLNLEMCTIFPLQKMTHPNDQYGPYDCFQWLA